MTKIKKDGTVRYCSGLSLKRFLNQGYEVVEDGGQEATETHTERQTVEEEQKELSEMKVDELKELAKEKGIDDYYNMRKSELITALESE